jgi:DNA polymerase III delta prime subunit
MQFLQDTITAGGSLHHAYVISPHHKDVKESLFDFLRTSLQFEPQANPDFYYFETDTFTIEDGRRIKDMQQMRAFKEGGKRIFVVSFDFITVEAQNALLKVLEEPVAGAHFFLLCGTPEFLLPTVLSRVMKISAEHVAPSTNVDVFAKASVSKRLLLIAGLSEDKDKAGALAFVSELENVYQTYLLKNPTQEIADALKNIIAVRSYLLDRASNVKMLLEMLSISLPLIS